MSGPYKPETRGSSEAARRKVLAYWGLTNPLGRLVLVCDSCGVLMEATRAKTWEADHTIPVALGGADACPNLVPLCCDCHRTKTSTEDIPRIAKGKQQRDKHFGVRRAKGFRRPHGARFDWATGRYVKEDK